MAERVYSDKPQIPDEPGKRVTRSVLKFDTNVDARTGICTEELFLLYSIGRENGPGINRDGKHSPWMTNPNQDFRTVNPRTTDPDIQRYGSYFINQSLKQADIERLEKKIKKVGKDSPLGKELTNLLEKNKEEECYQKQFEDHYPDYEIVAIQGIGDLTMNQWNVAYVNDEITRGPKLLHLLEEPIHDREYTCLVKWKKPTRDGRYLEIKTLRFDRFLFNSSPEDPGVVQSVEYDGRGRVTLHGIAHQIEFAVYGQQVIRPKHDNPNVSEVFNPREIVHQFSDIRHLLQLPNLNPDGPLGADTDRPRYLFGRPQADDIWFGEAELLDSRNLRKAAIAGSIELSTLYCGLGASEDQVRAALTLQGYTESTSPSKPLRYESVPEHEDPPEAQKVSEWRFVCEDPALVEVRLRENRYPCTILGIDGEGKLYLFAWQGVYSKHPGWTIRQAAWKLLTFNVRSAILCDEGGDVFQFFRENEDLDPVIEPKRGQIRAVFVVARKKR